MFGFGGQEKDQLQDNMEKSKILLTRVKIFKNQRKENRIRLRI